MKTSKIKEIANILIFIKGITRKTISEKLSYSYISLCKFLGTHSKMTFEHIEELFNALDFPLSMAMILSEKNYDRKELIEQVLKVM